MDPLRLSTQDRWVFVRRVMDEFYNDSRAPPGILPDAFSTIAGRYNLIARAARIAWQMLTTRTPNLPDLLEVTRSRAPQPIDLSLSAEEQDAVYERAIKGPRVDFFSREVVRPGIPVPSASTIILLNLPVRSYESDLCELLAVDAQCRQERGNGLPYALNAPYSGNYYAYNHLGSILYVQSSAATQWVVYLAKLCTFPRLDRGNWMPPHHEAMGMQESYKTW